MQKYITQRHGAFVKLGLDDWITQRAQTGTHMAHESLLILSYEWVNQVVGEKFDEALRPLYLPGDTDLETVIRQVLVDGIFFLVAGEDLVAELGTKHPAY